MRWVVKPTKAQERYSLPIKIVILFTSNLVSKPLGLNNSDVINDTLVCVEVIGQSILSHIS
jgi:hypothetical protein